MGWVREGETGGVPHHQVSNTHSVPHTTSLPTPTSRSLWRGITTTLSIILPLFCMEHPKPNHRCSVFGILAQPRPLALCWQTCSPPAATMSSIRTHHLPALPYPAVSHGMPETEPRVLSFWDFGPTPTPHKLCLKDVPSVGTVPCPTLLRLSSSTSAPLCAWHTDQHRVKCQAPTSPPWTFRVLLRLT